jgi:hypothetical protein
MQYTQKIIFKKLWRVLTSELSMRTLKIQEIRPEDRFVEIIKTILLYYITLFIEYRLAIWIRIKILCPEFERSMYSKNSHNAQ